MAYYQHPPRLPDIVSDVVNPVTPLPTSACVYQTSMSNKIKIDLQSVARVANGRVDGDASLQVKRLRSLPTATADSLTFYMESTPRAQLKASEAGAVLLCAEHADWFGGNKIIVDDPYLAYARVSALFAPPHPAPNLHPSAIIASGASGASVDASVTLGAYSVIGERVTLAADVVIGSHVSIDPDCSIGRGSTLENGVRIYSGTRIGANCHVAACAIIGASGFGYAPHHGKWEKIQQLGGVLIGDEVDIGAHTTIDRGALEDTIIGNGVKLDNHIQIAHNVQVGEHTIMAGCVAIAGSAVIGKRCRLGGRAAILGHLQIADEVTINANSFVASDIKQSGVYSSMLPAQPAERWRKIVAHINRLEQLVDKVKRLRTK